MNKADAEIGSRVSSGRLESRFCNERKSPDLIQGYLAVSEKYVLVVFDLCRPIPACS